MTTSVVVRNSYDEVLRVTVGESYVINNALGLVYARVRVYDIDSLTDRVLVTDFLQHGPADTERVWLPSEILSEAPEPDFVEFSPDNNLGWAT